VEAGVTLARNTLFNLLGHAAPLVAALFFVPMLVARLDADRFGFLSIAWVLVGYFSLFDLGLGRVLSRLIAERAGTDRERELPELARNALGLTFLLGVAAGLLLFVLATPLCREVLHLPRDLYSEAVVALRLLAVCLPVITLTAALRGLLEGRHRFDVANAIRAPLGVFTFGAPLAAALWSPSLVGLSVALVALRFAAFAAHWFACARLFPSLTQLGLPRPRTSLEMLNYGAWMTVSNIVGPVMVYIDRFLIGALLTVSAVAYYTAPHELVTRLWLIPAALAGVLFPAFAGSSDERVLRLYRTGVKAIMVAVFPLAFVCALFAPEWMHAWLGAEYASRGARVAQLLCIGVTLNCLAYVPFTLLQARGRADLTGKLHLAELPIYIASLLVLVPSQGIDGAAVAWSVRCAIDAAALFLIAQRKAGFTEPVFRVSDVTSILVTLASLAVALLPFDVVQKIVVLLAVLVAFGILTWTVLLDRQERTLARDPFALLKGGGR
jgi:O-antigen/teichoic acid export membrane protein